MTETIYHFENQPNQDVYTFCKQIQDEIDNTRKNGLRALESLQATGWLDSTQQWLFVGKFRNFSVARD